MMRVRAGLWAVAGLALASTARAETPDELFQRGRSLATEQHYVEACPLLAESVKAAPGIGARLWLAECYEKTGRLASALGQFKAAAAQAAQRKDEREKVAARRATALEPRVPRIVVVAADGVALTLDDATTTAGKPDPVDAGLHTIVASAPGFAPWSVSVSVPDGPGTVTVNVPAFEAPPAAAPAPEPAPEPGAVPAPEPRRAPAPPRATPGFGALQVASIAAGAAGLAALGGGIFLGLSAKSKYDASNQDGHCVQNACDAAGKEMRHTATSTATLSTLAFAGAGAAIASSIVLYVLSPSTRVAPSVGSHEAGLSLTRSF